MFKSKSALVCLLFVVALSLLASPVFATERADLVQSTPTNAKNAVDRNLEGDGEEDCHDEHDHRKLEGDGEEDCHHDDHDSAAGTLSTAISAAVAAGAIAFSIF